MCFTVLSFVSAWVMGIIYYQIKTNTGVDLKPLLIITVATFIVGLYSIYRNNKKSKEEES